MGGLQIWDAGTGQGFSQYAEHPKRAWSVDFSQTNPTKFASGSDDCSVKLWSINEACFLFYHLTIVLIFQDIVILKTRVQMLEFNYLFLFFCLCLGVFLLGWLKLCHCLQ